GSGTAKANAHEAPSVDRSWAKRRADSRFIRSVSSLVSTAHLLSGTTAHRKPRIGVSWSARVPWRGKVHVEDTATIELRTTWQGCAGAFDGLGGHPDGVRQAPRKARRE